jgi:hypothetical protein
VVKNLFFAKRTQIENHKTLQINWMRKRGLASFPKRTHFPRRFVAQPFPFKARLAGQAKSSQVQANPALFMKKIFFPIPCSSNPVVCLDRQKTENC